MGLFSSLFSKDTDESEIVSSNQAAQLGKQLENNLSGEVFEGMRLDVLNKEGEHLLTGKIVELSEEDLTLGRLPGYLSFKLAEVGDEVTLSGYDKKLIPIRMTGTVLESNRILFKVKDLEVVSHTESRDTFRLPFTAPVSLYFKDDVHMKNPEQCTLVNISTGGCCVESQYVYSEDEILRIRIKLDDYPPFDFLGQIIRRNEHTPGKFWYGILFAQLTDQEITTLNKALFNLQIGIKDRLPRPDDL